MNELYELSSKYYLQFESYRPHLRQLWPYLIVPAIAGASFLYFAFLLISNSPELGKNNQFLTDTTFYITILFELIFLLSAEHLKKKRLSLVIKPKNQKKVDQKDLLREKKRWVKENMGIKGNQLLSIAENYHKMHSLYLENNSRIETHFMNFKRRIYNSLAKPRILSLLVFLASIISLILLKDVESSDAILPLTEWEEFKQFSIFVVFISVFILITWEAILALFQYLRIILTFLSIEFDPSKSKSPELIRRFIRDLLYLSELKQIESKNNYKSYKRSLRLKI